MAYVWIIKSNSHAFVDIFLFWVQQLFFFFWLFYEEKNENSSVYSVTNIHFTWIYVLQLLISRLCYAVIAFIFNPSYYSISEDILSSS